LIVFEALRRLSSFDLFSAPNKKKRAKGCPWLSFFSSFFFPSAYHIRLTEKRKARQHPKIGPSRRFIKRQQNLHR